MDAFLWESFDYTDDGFELLEQLRQEPYIFLLDSSLVHPQRGRYSFLGFDPFDIFQEKKILSLEPLRKRFKPFIQVKGEMDLPLSSGIIGFLSYDYGLRQEGIASRHKIGDLGLPDCLFGFYDCILTIDHLAKKLYVTSSGLPERNSLLRKKRAKERLKAIIKKLSAFEVKCSCASRFLKREVQLFGESVGESNFTPKSYCEAVRRALTYIHRGDIYQVNLSQRFSFSPQRKGIQPLEIFRNLRRFSPSCFSSYFDAGLYQILSSSPERFLCLKNGMAQTRPMKGTRPRSMSREEDRDWKRDLERSPKEKAELLMVTDLERNDLGKVCAYGSVKVKTLREIEEYQTVFQATSTIEGELYQGKDSFDLIQSCFPGGSITGCPKLRAMEIIEEIEPTHRSIYTGCFGYLSFSEEMDFNMLIRTLLIQENKIYFQVGGGIVADSIPEKEYEETLVKARGMKVSLEKFFVKENGLL